MRICTRWANENDVEILVALNNEFNGIGLTTNEVKESLDKTNELISLAILDDEPVGFACAQYFKSFCYTNLQGEITEMYIKETARRKGIASLLISFLELELRIRGVESVKIITGKNNDAAIKTYEQSNYIKKDHIVLRKIIT
ncbi:GNAT family N-acetyltransferase [Bacillus luteolus]|uniref:GNAT family N-acetyltransferase n=1 Tax=Litchfieldia luteola TaxID=682179 RepID=A0ABR9QN08_9BACI|nr:GNAT family N-acetyltransferase [Cytobacillus luteolus]MBE4909887.1 GNAT family N-acetyltransferase [Cytobacillus luteolus]MBP1942562.1 ribosomal protein S18 acetylase RimI-like enzyme [Cytobacillus luteolus]